ncbi:hypothetical protein [Terricaulis sp.]|uniref:hypothetical protein n=1 Tax=Terricaulis sp. TaxID=2768686 RepID=UPI003784EBFB
MRVTFWGAYGAAGLNVEHGELKLCHVTQHPRGSMAADDALVRAAEGADLLIYPGAWEEGLALKERASVRLLALAPADHPESEWARLAEAATQKSANVFFARRKMRIDL